MRIRGFQIGLPLAAALFLAACESRDEGKPEPSSDRLNLILVSIDTLRADHLGCYEYSRPTSPFIDALAHRRGSVLFEQCIAQAPNTAPSHMSIFTSAFPSVHGVPNLAPKPDEKGRRLPDTLKPLAQLLHDAGYVTAGITDGGFMHPHLGFAQGFDTYDCTYEGADRKVDRAVAWLEEHAEGERPFFLFLHTYEVHAPYLPPPPFRGRFSGAYKGWVKEYVDQCYANRKRGAFDELFKRREEFTEEDVSFLKALYDEEIAFTDQELGRLWRYLEEKGLWEELVVVVLSDHGEEFGEHGEFNHKQLYDEVVRVPLIFALPKDRFPPLRSRVKEQVSLIDVTPTVLELAGIETGQMMQGRSLVPLWRGRDAARKLPAFSEFITLDADPPVSMVRLEGMKLFNYLSGRHYEFYDLLEDGAEMNNIVLQRERDGKDLLRLLDAWHAENLKLRDKYKARLVDGSADSELYEQLKQLGY